MKRSIADKIRESAPIHRKHYQQNALSTNRITYTNKIHYLSNIIK